jgi:hypothetical protein
MGIGAIMTKKLILVGVLSLAVGCIVGSVFAQTRLGSRLARMTEERDRTSRELSRATADKNRTLQRVGALEKRNRQLEEETRALKEEAEALQADANAVAVESYAEPAGETVSAPETADASVAPDNAADGRRRGRRGAFGRTDEGLSEEERTARRERWETFRQEMRDQHDAFFQAELDAAPDRDTQDRIEAIREYSDSIRQLRDAMQEAKTDEERQALRESMDENMRMLRDLSQKQQDYMVRELATQYGITAKDKQNAFISAVRDLQSSPFFQGSPRGGGFGRFGGGAPARGDSGGR